MTPTERGEYQLWDTDSQNAVGFYDSLAEALRDVAETVEMYGPDSPEARSLSLIRLDVPTAQGHIAAGAALVRQALATPSGTPYAAR